MFHVSCFSFFVNFHLRITHKICFLKKKLWTFSTIFFFFEWIHCTNKFYCILLLFLQNGEKKIVKKTKNTQWNKKLYWWWKPQSHQNVMCYFLQFILYAYIRFYVLYCCFGCRNQLYRNDAANRNDLFTRRFLPHTKKISDWKKLQWWWWWWWRFLRRNRASMNSLRRRGRYCARGPNNKCYTMSWTFICWNIISLISSREQQMTRT